MEDIAINKKFVKAMEEKIPAGASIVQTVMDILSIGKEAAYRRIRGDVLFSFSEIVNLSKKLSISIDSFSRTCAKDKVYFQLIPISYWDITDYDYIMTIQFNEALKFIKDDPESEMIYASNLFPQFIFSRYYELAKFHSLKWGYQNKTSTLIKPFHEMDYSDDYFNINLSNVYYMEYFEYTCYILDQFVFQSMVNDIKYFNKIQLINNEDVKKVKEKLLFMLTDFEKMAATGKFSTGKKLNIYLSNINFETTYTTLKGNSFELSMIGVFGLNYVTSLDSRALVQMKQWMQVLKKASILISESGEAQRYKFFEKQRRIIDEL